MSNTTKGLLGALILIALYTALSQIPAKNKSSIGTRPADQSCATTKPATGGG